VSGGFNGDATEGELREFVIAVRARFAEIPRVKKAAADVDLIEFLDEHEDTIEAYCPYKEDAILVLAHDF
jgi:hypothetical protein